MMTANCLTADQRSRSEVAGLPLFASGHGFGLGLAVVMVLALARGFLFLTSTHAF